MARHLAPWTNRGRRPPMAVGAWVRAARPGPYWGMAGLIDQIAQEFEWVRVVWNPGPGEFRAKLTPHELVVETPADSEIQWATRPSNRI